MALAFTSEQGLAASKARAFYCAKEGGAVAKGRRAAVSRWWKQPRNKAFAAYAVRDAILRDLGFKSYKAYLASELWADIRLRVLRLYSHNCTSCGRPATQVHHTKYTVEVLNGSSLSGLRAICRGCHKSIEFNLRGKVPLDAANHRLRVRRKRHLKDECWQSDPAYRALWRQRKALLNSNSRNHRQEINALRRQMRRLIRERGRDPLHANISNSGRNSVHGEIHESATDDG